MLSPHGKIQISYCSDFEQWIITHVLRLQCYAFSVFYSIAFCRITGGDRKLFGEASYQLGSACINNGDPQTALTVGTLKPFSVIHYFHYDINFMHVFSAEIVGG